MPVTYDNIATTTLGSPASTITFSSIPATYTDLRLVFAISSTSAGGQNIVAQVNGNSSSIYSRTVLFGNGSSAGSTGGVNNDRFVLNYEGTSTTLPCLVEIDFLSYAGSTNKTILTATSEDTNGSGAVVRTVQLWRNTSAINTILLYLTGGNFNAGTTATLYGIKNA